MSQAPRNEASAVLEQALACLSSGSAEPLLGPETAGFSERCVEVPWVAAHLGSARRLLDVGWAMSPPEWLGVLLAVQDAGCDLTGIDIIDPQRVRSRYPVDLVERVLCVPIRIESVLDAEPTAGLFDTMTCVSTLEHIGFDMASPPGVIDTAFVRAKTPDEAVATRDPATDRAFMDAAARLLEPGGHLLVSVPAGFGEPILHQDSLGLFTHQFEYDEPSWRAVTGDPRFTVLEQAYFRHEGDAGWQEVEAFSGLTHQTSALKPFATGCATALLKRA